VFDPQVSLAAGFTAPTRPSTTPAARVAGVTMGPAKDGPFTPIVRGARLVLGDKTLSKLRGKGIALHSQAINGFCDEYGVPKKLNQALIKKAKIVGSDLGFLS